MFFHFRKVRSTYGFTRILPRLETNTHACTLPAASTHILNQTIHCFCLFEFLLWYPSFLAKKIKILVCLYCFAFSNEGQVWQNSQRLKMGILLSLASPSNRRDNAFALSIRIEKDSLLQWFQEPFMENIRSSSKKSILNKN